MPDDITARIARKRMVLLKREASTLANIERETTSLSQTRAQLRELDAFESLAKKYLSDEPEETSATEQEAPSPHHNVQTSSTGNVDTQGGRRRELLEAMLSLTAPETPGELGRLTKLRPSTVRSSLKTALDKGEVELVDVKTRSYRITAKGKACLQKDTLDYLMS